MVPVTSRGQVVKLKGGIAYTVKPNYPIGIQADGYGRITDHTLLFDLPFAGMATEEVAVLATDSDGDKEVEVVYPWRFVMPKTSAAATDRGQHAYVKHNNELQVTTAGLTYVHDVGVVVDVIGTTHLVVESRQQVPIAGLTLAEGNMLRGDASGNAEAFSAKTSGRILVGDATTVNSVAVSGDATLSAAGVVAIASDVIINADVKTDAAIAWSKMAALASAHLLVGSAGNVATDVAVTGDMSITNAGVTAIASDVIVNADVKSDAAIAWSKMAALVSAHLLVGSAGNVATDVAITGDVTISNTGVTAITADTVINADVKSDAAIAWSKMAALASAHILVGSAGGVATDVAMSGVIAITNAGVTSIVADSVVNADVNAAAAIAFSKLAALASGNILVGSAGNVATSVTMSGDATLANTGALTVGQTLDAGNAANVGAAGSGLALAARANWTDAGTGDITITAPFAVKVMVTDVIACNHTANGANANTVQLCAGAAGANPITDAMSLNGLTDGLIVRPTTVDDDGNGIVAAGVDLYLRQVKVAGVMGGTLHIRAIPVA